MKKRDFLTRLHRENKLQIVEPSEEMKKAYLNKSSASTKSAEILLQNSLLENSVPMAYYSMYNMALALFFKTGIKCENHAASIILLKTLFELDNSKIEFAKKERVDKQYYVDFKISSKEVKELISTEKEFNSHLYDFIDKLTIKDAAKYRNKLSKML
jgi:uncharacterized protein (UPF0332 family)